MIRIRHPQGTCSFPINDSETTFGALQTFIEQQAGIATAEQELKIGYPPKRLALESIGTGDLLTSAAVGIKKGEQVIVARKAGSSVRTVAAAAESSSSSSHHATSSFGALGGPKPNISTATGPGSSYGLGARSLQDGSTARNPSGSSALGAATAKVTDGSVSIPLLSSRGSVTLKAVPDDNSCLFNSVGFLFHHRLGSDLCQGLRSIVAAAIRSDPASYPDIVLGQPRESYISKILSPQTWGGAIELSILAKHFAVELTSIDIATGTIHRFGEDQNYENRGIVVYSGIHYDAIYLQDGIQTTTVFPNLMAMGVLEEEEDEVLVAARRLCDELKRRRYYTDTANFSLRCKQCGTALKGEKEAVEHAKTTGHGDFGEV